MRFAYLATIATLVVGTTAANPNSTSNSCALEGLSLNLIIEHRFQGYNEEIKYLKGNSNSSVASSITLYNRIQIPYLQDLCGEVEYKTRNCSSAQKPFVANSNCAKIKKLSPFLKGTPKS
ncbi:hypothetical protein IWQ61_010760 [Dispira simplex]|nr:hypothetical protein IWQ61_010760 [Dispira simplex]